MTSTFEDFHEFDAQYDLSRYYEAIKDITFESRFVSVQEKHIRAIVDAGKLTNQGGASLDDQNQAADEKKSMRNIRYEGEYADELLDIMNLVDKEIALLLEAGDDWGVFVRTNNLSGKDAVMWTGGMKDALFEYLQSIQAQNGVSLPLDTNGEMVAIMNACCQAMRVRCAEEAFFWMIRSDRVLRYLQRCLDIIEKEDGKQQDLIDVQIVVREWHHLDIANEFRGFVHKGKLTGISQSFTQVFFEELKDEGKREEIRDQLVECFNKNLAEQIELESYVIDFVIQNDQVFVIELMVIFRTPCTPPKSHTPHEICCRIHPTASIITLFLFSNSFRCNYCSSFRNPWHESTGGLLFSWQEDDDVLHGRGERDWPVMRVVEEVPGEVKGEPWRDIFDDMYEHIEAKSGQGQCSIQ